MNTKLISIIIPMYNAAQYIGDCLKSCLCQTCESWEVIVVNDASTDNSAGIVESYVDGRIRLHHFKGNRGFAIARNYAIRQSLGEFIVPIDSDDMLTEDSLEVRLKAFEKNPELEFVHGPAYDDVPENATLGWCANHKSKLLNSPRTQRQFSKEHKKKIHAQGMMVRKSVFEKHGLYYDILSKADKELTYRLGIHPLSPFPSVVKHKKIKEFVAYYRRRDGSMKSGLNTDKKDELKGMLGARMAQLKAEGITKENTPWL